MQKTLFVTVLLLSCSAVWAQQTKLKAELVKVFNDHTNVEYVTFNEKGSQIASGGVITRVRDNILKSKEQKNIQPTKGGHKMVTCQNYVSLFYCQITSCPSDGGIS